MQEDDRNARDWCAIWGTILTSSCLMCMGFVLLVDGIDNTAGYSLLFSGGILLVLSIMAALGKCRLNRTYSQDVNHDPPPSYRWSWRRSFLRRHPSCRTTDNRLISRNRQEERGTLNQATDSQDGEVSETLSSYSVSTIRVTSSPRNNMSDISIPMSGTPAEGERYAEEGRLSVNTLIHAHSFSSVVDPPCYEVAVANMDERTLRKLKSEVDLRTLSRVVEFAGGVK